jgi:hypothetical protein
MFKIGWPKFIDSWVQHFGIILGTILIYKSDIFDKMGRDKFIEINF